MGNLNLQRPLDSRGAARCYELILVDWPGWESSKAVYPRHVVCYQQINGQDNLRQPYRRMLKAFPEDSQEHLYAKTQLPSVST